MESEDINTVFERNTRDLEYEEAYHFLKFEGDGNAQHNAPTTYYDDTYRIQFWLEKLMQRGYDAMTHDDLEYMFTLFLDPKRQPPLGGGAVYYKAGLSECLYAGVRPDLEKSTLNIEYYICYHKVSQGTRNIHFTGHLIYRHTPCIEAPVTHKNVYFMRDTSGVNQLSPKLFYCVKDETNTYYESGWTVSSVLYNYLFKK